MKKILLTIALFSFVSATQILASHKTVTAEELINYINLNNEASEQAKNFVFELCQSDDENERDVAAQVLIKFMGEKWMMDLDNDLSKTHEKYYSELNNKLISFVGSRYGIELKSLKQ
jgi:hypothetical protein